MNAGAPRRLTVAAPDGAALAAWSEGEGPALLLVSGLGGTAAFWNRCAPALAQRFRVIRFDQRGIGASGRGDAPCTIDQLALDCLAVLDAAAAPRAVLLGHSTGGCIGQALARRAPTRLDGLILSAGWRGPSRYMTALFRTRRALLDLDAATYAATSALLAHPPAWLEANWSVFDAALAAAPTTHEARRIVRERIDALLAFDATDAPAPDLPTLILGARDDMIVPHFLQDRLSAALPDAQRRILDDGGHFYPVTSPDAFAAAVLDWAGAGRRG